MGKIKYLMIHSTATPEGREVSPEDIKEWHTSPKPRGRGWSRVGYADMILLNGTLENLIPFNQDNVIDSFEISNGAKGYNGIAKHVVYVGGKTADNKQSKDTRNFFQKRTLEIYVRFMILRHPQIKVIGHNQVSSKDCPGYDVPTWLRDIGIEEKNIADV